MSGANTQQQQPRLIPANTTLLQPGSNWFRLMDALGQITVLQQQIAVLNARLTKAGIP